MTIKNAKPKKISWVKPTIITFVIVFITLIGIRFISPDLLGYKDFDVVNDNVNRGELFASGRREGREYREYEERCEEYEGYHQDDDDGYRERCMDNTGSNPIPKK